MRSSAARVACGVDRKLMLLSSAQGGVKRLAAGPGGDLLERETSARHQHAAHLAVKAIAIGDIHGRIL